MRQLEDSEVQARADMLKKRHRSEWSRLVYEASVGRSTQQVANLLAYTKDGTADEDACYVLRWIKRHDRQSAESRITRR